MYGCYEGLWSFERCFQGGEQSISEEVKRAVAEWAGAEKADERGTSKAGEGAQVCGIPLLSRTN